MADLRHNDADCVALVVGRRQPASLHRVSLTVNTQRSVVKKEWKGGSCYVFEKGNGRQLLTSSRINVDLIPNFTRETKI